MTNFPTGPQIKKAIRWGLVIITLEVIIIATCLAIIYVWLSNNL